MSERSLFNKQIITFLKINKLSIAKLAKILHVVSGKRIAPQTIYNWIETEHGVTRIGNHIVGAFMHLQQNFEEYNLLIPEPSITESIVIDVLNSMVERGEVEKTQDGKYRSKKNHSNRADR